MLLYIEISCHWPSIDATSAAAAHDAAAANGAALNNAAGVADIEDVSDAVASPSTVAVAEMLLAGQGDVACRLENRE